ncbi:MAG: hypothetical protein U0Q03_00630 [Acidimicrobiales bacterium]
MVDDDLQRIGAQARRALASIGATRIDLLAGKRRAELLGLHGVGRRALQIIEEALVE